MCEPSRRSLLSACVPGHGGGAICPLAAELCCELPFVAQGGHGGGGELSCSRLPFELAAIDVLLEALGRRASGGAHSLLSSSGGIQ